LAREKRQAIGSVLVAREAVINQETVSAITRELLRRATIKLPLYVKEAILQAYERETSQRARDQLRIILDNISIAEEYNLCVCQDTGVPLFYVKVGSAVSVEGDIREAIARGTKLATEEIPLRQNVIHPLTKKNSGTNTGWGMPYVHFDVEPDVDYMEITVLPKGFGSEAKTSLLYIATSEDIALGLTKCVLETVLSALGEPCPPYIIGIGLGGTAEIATWLAKKAFLRPLGASNPDPLVAKLEADLLQAVNKTGIGAMGVGGSVTALGVHIEFCGTHTAAVPVAISFQCWAARSSTARIYSNDRVEYLTKH
jgi:fumarate hydratase subunit alpha